jgi:hypothetical protein
MRGQRVRPQNEQKEEVMVEGEMRGRIEAKDLLHAAYKGWPEALPTA